MKPMSEIRAAYTSLNFALILSSCVAFLLMILPVVLIANRIIHPINQIHAVTTAMSQGNFTLRANMQQKGEINELTRAINQLASDLNLTISALLLEKNRLQQLLDGLNEGIFAVDSEFRITHNDLRQVPFQKRQDNLRFWIAEASVKFHNLWPLFRDHQPDVEAASIRAAFFVHGRYH